ncbi:uncharacterized protein BX664DRAFT_330441 [Halteromyces radiatus]|uniref:uncharacterized protein n=1 Tax=Halteromyces radiatus TaxID=101107 RepID=UPI0022202BCC|nr:uncharacterized protein BX664DRAFT_330441 [Halteromyces radiatus]KAI8093729.1 hypothetical protein BX664DRAFT_330441 [Halteromyces radiatus]
MTRVAIVTGANAGVGYGIIQHLLQTEKDTTIVMACRNLTKAQVAKTQLLQQFVNATIEIELIDVGSVTSVLNFCERIKRRYDKINYLFCNAGILSTSGVDWIQSLKMFFTDPVGLMERSDAAIQVVGEINSDGMGKVFAANVFGHYIMMRDLESLLANSKDGRVIWTSSITANDTCFDINDWQGLKSTIPYESSKWACDLLSVACHNRFQKENLPISSFTTSPGVVASNIGELPIWITELRKLLHYLMRFMGVTSQNISGYRGALADAFVALSPVSSLNEMVRYLASTDRWGQSYVDEQPLLMDMATAEQLYKKCEVLYQAYKTK